MPWLLCGEQIVGTRLRAIRDYGCVLAKDGGLDQVVSWKWRAVDRFQMRKLTGLYDCLEVRGEGEEGVSFNSLVSGLSS